jgi:hypothetical protein
VEKVSKKLIA